MVEGFLSVLLNEAIRIEEVLNAESNNDTADDKHNRVDVLVRDAKGNRIIIEVQNSRNPTTSTE